MALPTVNDVEAEEVVLGCYEVKTADLAEIVGVSASTIHKWVKDDVTAPVREDYFGGGRPGLVFSLHDVVSDLADEPTKQKYLPLLDAEIARRALAEEEEDARLGDEEQAQEDTLVEHLQALAEQGLVEEVNQSSPDPLPEVLVEILRDRLGEVEIRLVETQSALTKMLRHNTWDEDAEIFTYAEAVAMHNAVTSTDMREAGAR